MGVFGKLIQCTMPILSSVLSVLSHSPSHYYAVAFLGWCAQVFQIYSDWKITDPHFQENKMWPISVHPCQCIKLPAHQIAQTKMGFRQKLDACKQKQLWEAVLMFWDEDIVFLGHTNWSTKHGGSNQSRTADIPSKVPAAVNHSGSYLFLHKQTDTQTVLTKFHK